jgi:hypothetical protein
MPLSTSVRHLVPCYNDHVTIGQPKTVGVRGEKVAPLLSRDKLIMQGNAFRRDLKDAAVLIMDIYDGAVREAGGMQEYKGPSPTTMLWAHLEGGVGPAMFINELHQVSREEQAGGRSFELHSAPLRDEALFPSLCIPL